MNSSVYGRSKRTAALEWSLLSSVSVNPVLGHDDFAMCASELMQSLDHVMAHGKPWKSFSWKSVTYSGLVRDLSATPTNASTSSWRTGALAGPGSDFQVPGTKEEGGRTVAALWPLVVRSRCRLFRTGLRSALEFRSRVWRWRMPCTTPA